MEKPAYNFADGTFFFLKAFGRRPLGALWIALWQIVLYSAITLATLALILPFFNQMMELAAQNREPDPSEVFRAFASVAAGMTLATVGSLLAALLVQAAWLRFLVRDEIAPVIPLRLGMDELRLAGVNIIVYAIFIIGGYLLFLAYAMAVAAGTVGLVAASGEPGVGLAVTLVVLNLVFFFAAVGAGVYLAIRFAAAQALTVHTRKFRLFESFAATQGITLWMLVSYLVIFILFFVVFSVVAVIQFVFIFLAAADLIPTLEALQNTDDPRVVLEVLRNEVFQPGVLIPLGIVVVAQYFAQILLEGSLLGVGAYAATREGAELGEGEIETPSQSVGDAPKLG